MIAETLNLSLRETTHSIVNCPRETLKIQRSTIHEHIWIDNLGVIEIWTLKPRSTRYTKLLRQCLKAVRTGEVFCKWAWPWAGGACGWRRRAAGGGRARRPRGSRARAAAAGASPRAWWRGSCGRARCPLAPRVHPGIWRGCPWSGRPAVPPRRRRSFCLQAELLLLHVVVVSVS